jgi:hypothetical protein
VLPQADLLLGLDYCDAARRPTATDCSFSVTTFSSTKVNEDGGYPCTEANGRGAQVLCGGPQLQEQGPQMLRGGGLQVGLDLLLLLCCSKFAHLIKQSVYSHQRILCVIYEGVLREAGS